MDTEERISGAMQRRVRDSPEVPGATVGVRRLAAVDAHAGRTLDVLHAGLAELELRSTRVRIGKARVIAVACRRHGVARISGHRGDDARTRITAANRRRRACLVPQAERVATRTTLGDREWHVTGSIAATVRAARQTLLACRHPSPRTLAALAFDDGAEVHLALVLTAHPSEFVGSFERTGVGGVGDEIKIAPIQREHTRRVILELQLSRGGYPRICIRLTLLSRED